MLPSLSKSKFQYGLQCLKRLYLQSYQPGLADPVDQAQRAIFDAGHAVGKLARGRFPNGRLVEECYAEHDQAVRTTETLLAGAEVPPLYEAAFTFEDIKTRVDILTRGEGQAFDLVEVKSSTQVKPEHISDVGIQMHVVEGAGTPVDTAYLMHLNRAYVHQGGDYYDPDRLFTLEDVTKRARAFIEQHVPGDLSRMWAALQESNPPDIEIGPHCNKPYRCSFYGHCHASEVVQTKPAFNGPNLRAILDKISFPISFMDFETFNPALPRYVGTSPYQVIPFQWSLHVLDSSGETTHYDFLNDDAEDPREHFIVSLLQSIPSEGSIVVYSPYERTILGNLAQKFPDYANQLLALCDRMVDLMKATRPAFKGGYSLKAVAPVLAPRLSYADLAIQQGAVASVQYADMIADGVDERAKAKIREDLLAYCARDTEALMHVYKALIAEAGAPSARS